MNYDWNSVPDSIPELKEGYQLIKIFDTTDRVNINGKRYLAIKGSVPDIVDTAIAENDYDENGVLKAYPQTSINIYYESDFGLRILKNILVAGFGKENLEHLQDMGIIVTMLKKKMPIIKAELKKNGNFMNIKEMTASEAGAATASVPPPKKAAPKRKTAEQKAQELVDKARANMAKAAEAQAESQASEPDLPF
jgi:hypothetical protein